MSFTLFSHMLNLWHLQQVSCLVCCRAGYSAQTRS